MDKKGRAVLKREILDRAGVETPCALLASVKSEGVIELKRIGKQLERAKAIGAKRFKGWKEEEHAGEKFLFKMLYLLRFFL